MVLSTPPLRILVWSEFTEPKEVYPQGIHGAIADYLRIIPGLEVKAAELSDPEQGLSEAVLGQTDALFWFGHIKHHEVSEEAALRIVKRVREGGMGFVPLHSSHFSKPFKALMGTDCGLGGWREDGKPEYVHVVSPDHPIAEGVVDFVVPQDEMYNEPFAVPPPETVVLESRWESGEYLRSGCCWTCGKGRVFYFRPGHETFPVFRQPEVQRILRNAAYWAAGVAVQRSV